MHWRALDILKRSSDLNEGSALASLHTSTGDGQQGRFIPGICLYDLHRNPVCWLILFILKKMSMIKKYHTLQTKPWHREEEPQNTHKTSGIQLKQSNELSLRKTRKDTK